MNLSLVTTRFDLPDAPFGARLRTLPLGAAQLSEVSYTTLRGRRTPRLIRQSDPEMYQLILVRGGRQRLDQARNEASITPGDLVLYDSSRPSDATAAGHPGRSRSVILRFPRTLLPQPVDRVASVLATPISGRSGVGRLVAVLMTELAKNHHDCTAQDLARLGTTALDIVTTLVGQCLGRETEAPAEARETTMFLRVVSFIHTHLPSPELSPGLIAAAHQLSPRSLQRLFQQQGTTVTAFIREQRLDRCRRDLADPTLGALAIHRIGARWGYPRAADFTRAFRGATGMTPSEYRAAARLHAVPHSNHTTLPLLPLDSTPHLSAIASSRTSPRPFSASSVNPPRTNGC